MQIARIDRIAIYRVTQSDDGVLDWSEQIDDSRCRFEVRGLEFLHGLEFAYSNDVVGEASSGGFSGSD